ncbi:hypothetical protein K1719_024095 [Acacia pycnantha]|nr:hypothetical protein K1719_024095 [Acacia pycnantha]
MPAQMTRMLYWGEDDRRRLVRSVTLRGSGQFGKGRSEKKKPAKILSLLAQFNTDGCILLRGFLGNLNLT